MSEKYRAPRTDPIFSIRCGRLRGKMEVPAGPSRSVLRLSLTSCCGAGVPHRPRRAWHSYSLARTDSSEKARRTHASRPFAVLRAICGRETSRSWDPFNTRATSRIYRGCLWSTSMIELDRIAYCTGIDIVRFKIKSFDYRENLLMICLYINSLR